MESSWAAKEIAVILGLSGLAERLWSRCKGGAREGVIFSSAEGIDLKDPGQDLGH